MNKQQLEMILELKQLHLRMLRTLIAVKQAASILPTPNTLKKGTK